jgi:2-polyprenyl-3-methyl-5-hydroxy-6-metoxy-1,4-benzoquinol methylase
MMDHSINAVNIFNKWAKEYQDKFMDVNAYSDTFNFFCDAIEKNNAEVLELACGPGNITKYLLNKRSDLKILGTDLAPKMIELAKVNNPNANFEIMDSRAIFQINKKFDAIMCGFCLPYLSKNEALQLIHDASKILNANGVIYISTMEDDYNQSGFKKGSKGDEIFMHYHQSDYLCQALENNHFEILKMHRQNFDYGDGTKATDLILIGKKIEK